MRTVQRYGLGCSCPAMEHIVFLLEDILTDQSLKCLRQSKIIEYFTANFVCDSVNLYCTFKLYK